MRLIGCCNGIVFALGLAALAACSSAAPEEEQRSSESNLIRGQEEDRQRRQIEQCADEEYRTDHPVNCNVRGGSDPDADELDVDDEPATPRDGKKRDTLTKYKCGYCELLSEEE